MEINTDMFIMSCKDYQAVKDTARKMKSCDDSDTCVKCGGLL
jgi:hypothetical protein